MARDPFDFQEFDNTTDLEGAPSVTFLINNFGDFEAKVVVQLSDPIPKNDGTLKTEHSISYGVGKNMVSPDGRVLVGVDGDVDAKVNGNTAWAKFCKRMVELVGKDALIAAGASAYTTDGWDQFVMHWTTEHAGEKYTMTATADSIGWMQKRIDNGEGTAKQDGREVDTIMDGDSFTGKKAGKDMPDALVASHASSNGKAPKAFDLAALALPDATYEALNTLAQQSSADEFMVGAVRHRSESGDPVAFMEAVKSGDLYERLAII
jgi:hypothetical protein